MCALCALSFLLSSSLLPSQWNHIEVLVFPNNTSAYLVAANLLKCLCSVDTCNFTIGSMSCLFNNAVLVDL